MKKILFNIGIAISTLCCLSAFVDSIFVIIGYAKLNDVNNINDYQTATKLLEISRGISIGFIVLMIIAASLFIAVVISILIDKFKEKE